MKNEDPSDLARSARVSASSATARGAARQVIDGYHRELFSHLGLWADGGTHRWESVELPAWIELSWETPRSIAEIHLTFDTGFQRELILSDSDSTTRKVIRGPQPETVRDYTLLLDGQTVITVSGNYLRKRVHRLDQPRLASRLRLHVTATQGLPHARLFECRVY